MSNFWKELPKPRSDGGQAFFCLAPMYDVTDAAFRAMFAKYGKPDVLFTEFVSADGLASEEGRPKLLRELYFTPAERPIVAQIFGSHPETIEQAVKLIRELKFDGVDINMGCPDRAVEKQGAGSALIKNPELAKEIILAAKRGACNENDEQVIPVSVKTRIGYNKIDTENWARTILETKPLAVTFHLRTRKELSDVEAHWEEAKILGELGREYGIPIICNGDVQSVEEGRELAEKYKIDGVMIGRGAFGRPDFFRLDRAKSDLATRDTTSHNLALAVEHAKIFWDLYGPTETNKKLFNSHTKNFSVMRKHFKAYVSGFRGALALRAKLMETQNPAEVEAIINDFLSSKTF